MKYDLERTPIKGQGLVGLSKYVRHLNGRAHAPFTPESDVGC